MKIKSIIAFAGLLGSAFFSTAFICKAPVAKIPVVVVQNKEFLEFLSHFEKVKLPYGIGLKDMEGYDYFKKGGNKNSIQGELEEGKKSPIARSKFIPNNEFRVASRNWRVPTLEALARFYPNEKTVAVVYSSTAPFGRGFYVDYNMVVYDLKGNVLSGIKQKNNGFSMLPFSQVAYSTTKKTMTCSIDANGNIWKNTYENKWEHDISEKGIEGNVLVDFKLQKTDVFKIGIDGSITELKGYPTVSRASLD